MVVGLAAAGNQAGGLGPVDQLDSAVVAKEQVVGRLADGRTRRIAVTPYGQQQLVLGGGQPGGLGLLGAPVLESTKAGTEREEPLVGGVVKVGHCLRG